LYGLAAAKQYHEQHPKDTLAVLDYASSVGGVWAEHRLYPGLKTNNMVGTYEYPDFPMEPSVFGVQPGQHPPGTVVHEYFEAYATKAGILDLIRYGTKVLSAHHQDDGGWILTVCPVGDSDPKAVRGAESKIFTKKLVVATGLTSEPLVPHIEGQESYGQPLFHYKDFKQNADTLDAENTKRVTVFGGTKGGWDAVYAYGSKGIKVDWVVRGIISRHRL
jgi:cation diffusion facilitator CzcD-associated flavoprotein CzcO